MRRIESAQLPVPRLRLDQLRPRAPALPDDLYELLRTEPREGLTDDGWAHSDVEPLARIALGRAVLADGPLEHAVLEAAYDYVACADTLRHARDGYAGRLAPGLGDGALRPDPDAAQRQPQELIERRFLRDVERTLERDQLVEERGDLEQMLNEAIAMFDPFECLVLPFLSSALATCLEPNLRRLRRRQVYPTGRWRHVCPRCSWPS